MIIAVASPPGTGKTEWICRQIAQTNKPVGYFSPKTDSVPIDTIYLQSKYPQLKIYHTREEAALLTESDQTITYIEIPWYLNLSGIEPLLTRLNSHRVAVISADTKNTEFKTWADEVVSGNQVTKLTTSLQIHRGVLTGEILDFDSLATFWLEMTQGAYGEVVRAKGIFDLEDGQIYYGDFMLVSVVILLCWQKKEVKSLTNGLIRKYIPKLGSIWHNYPILIKKIIFLLCMVVLVVTTNICYPKWMLLQP
jgi:hypothetical protein